MSFSELHPHMSSSLLLAQILSRTTEMRISPNYESVTLCNDLLLTTSNSRHASTTFGIPFEQLCIKPCQVQRQKISLYQHNCSFSPSKHNLCSAAYPSFPPLPCCQIHYYHNKTLELKQSSKRNVTFRNKPSGLVEAQKQSGSRLRVTPAFWSDHS